MVSIIVPVYNRENYIARCVNSILKQTYKNIEVILVNDGSTDNSLEVINGLAAADRRVKVIDKPNGGTSAAVAAGVNNANGEYITFVDSDDYVGETLVENYLNAIEDFDVVGMGYYEDNGDIVPKKITGGIWQNEDLESLMMDWAKIPCVRWNKLFKKDILLKFMDVFSSLGIAYAEDVYFGCLLSYTVMVNNGRIKTVEEPNCYYYIINNSSVSHKNCDVDLCGSEFEKLIKADEKVSGFTKKEVNFSNKLIIVLGGYYIQNSKDSEELSKKESVKIIKAVLDNKRFQHALSFTKPKRFKDKVRKILYRLKFAKTVYFLI